MINFVVSDLETALVPNGEKMVQEETIELIMELRKKASILLWQQDVIMTQYILCLEKQRTTLCTYVMMADQLYIVIKL